MGVKLIENRVEMKSGGQVALNESEPLSPELLFRIDAYWRAANYLSAVQIYLCDNPLLRDPLKAKHIKPILLGHWDTTPSQHFIYSHLNRLVKKHNVNMICISGPGHGGQAMAAALGGLATLIFSGGTGEHSPDARLEISDGVEAIDIGVDRQRNTGNEIISNVDRRVTVRLIAADEEFVIAVMVPAMAAGQVEKHVGDRKSGGLHGT